jgi:hypothetical protein
MPTHAVSTASLTFTGFRLPCGFAPRGKTVSFFSNFQFLGENPVLSVLSGSQKLGNCRYVTTFPQKRDSLR